MNKGFTFYESFAQAAEKLKTDADRLAFYDAVVHYALHDEEPGPLPDVVDLMFTLVRPVLDKNKKNRENGQAGGRPRKAADDADADCDKNRRFQSEKTDGFRVVKPSTSIEIDNEIDKDIEEDKERETRGTLSQFRRPTIDEVEEAIKAEGLHNINPARFIAYYDARNWRLADGRPIHDWRAMLRSWGAVQLPSAGGRADPGRRGAFKVMPQGRQYDFDELETMLLARGCG